jgi:peptidoglycan/LPS O-acetylase OafA/YrhL
MERVKGLDQLRFIMAVIVLIGHGALPEFQNVVVRGVLGNSFVGIAAVMVFFILSGFVIHYPYATGEKKIKIIEFYFRRQLNNYGNRHCYLSLYLNLSMGVGFDL